jgi:hypothetical protein
MSNFILIDWPEFVNNLDPRHRIQLHTSVDGIRANVDQVPFASYSMPEYTMYTDNTASVVACYMLNTERLYNIRININITRKWQAWPSFSVFQRGVCDLNWCTTNSGVELIF